MNGPSQHKTGFADATGSDYCGNRTAQEIAYGQPRAERNLGLIPGSVFIPECVGEFFDVDATGVLVHQTVPPQSRSLKSRPGCPVRAIRTRRPSAFHRNAASMAAVSPGASGSAAMTTLRTSGGRTRP